MEPIPSAFPFSGREVDTTEGGWNTSPDSTAGTDTSKLSIPVSNSFYSLDPDQSNEATASAIGATVTESQTVVSGGTLSMRLSQPCTIAGIDLPAGQPIFGTVQLAGERMTVTIKSIRFENRIVPVALSAFDLDGIAGVAIPDGIARQVAKQSADQSIESLGLTSVDQSFGAQAATAGLQAAKNLLSKKVRIVTVTIPAGYEILLQDNQASPH
ncbi:conjugative transposon protein TraM [Puia sp. P3]|uniref:conjugative transposon protein TraM n=1 Tax=Puia sp. P3 TaxID=3423952 RepID=UPI003D678701